MKQYLRRGGRLPTVLPVLALLLSLAACKLDAPEEDGGASYTANELARAAVTASGRDPDSLERLGGVLDGAGIADYVSNYYGVEEDAWTDCAVYRAGGSEAFEIAVLRLRDEAGTQAAAAGLEQYIQEREGAFAGYFPAQADMVSRSLAASHGIYAALLICEHPETARDTFYAVLNGEDPPKPPDEGQTAPPADERAEPTADEMARALIAAAALDPDRLESAGDDTALASLGISPDVCEDFAMYWTPNWGVDGRILYLYVFKAEDPSALWNRVNVITSRDLENNRRAYVDSKGEFPFLSSEYRLFEGQYAAFLLTDEGYADTVYPAFYALLGLQWTGETEIFVSEPPGGLTPEGRFLYVDPENVDMTIYDTTPILTAWEEKDLAGLSEYDRAIYSAAVRVLEQVLTDGMTDYEKEYALYIWVVTHVEYDYSYQDTLAVVDRASCTPYGGLVNGKGVCLGFASTFQLLMDMAGVECITVVGASRMSTENHAWNQVRLDGEWYCVDAAWDNSYYPHLRWFNQTSDFFAQTSPGHQWDYGSVPEAGGTRYAA